MKRPFSVQLASGAAALLGGFFILWAWLIWTNPGSLSRTAVSGAAAGFGALSLLVSLVIWQMRRPFFVLYWAWLTVLVAVQAYLASQFNIVNSSERAVFVFLYPTICTAIGLYLRGAAKRRANKRLNLSVRSVTSRARTARSAPARPAG